MKIDKVLYPTDFSQCARYALTHALFIAEQFGAALHMLHGVVLHGDDPYHPGYHFPNIDEIYDRVHEIAASDLAQLLEDTHEQTLDIHQVQRRGLFPADTIIEYASEHDIDLIVMGTHGRRGASRFLMGSVAERVVRFARCPVLTLREVEQPTALQRFERLLVPIDFSEHARRALRHADALAKIYGARLVLLHVVEERPVPAFYDDAAAPRDDTMTRATEELDRLAASEHVTAPHESHVLRGRVASEIVRFAELQSCSLIVIATHGLTGFEHLLLGSTAEQVVRMATSPVFTLKGFGKSLVAAG